VTVAAGLVRLDVLFSSLSGQLTSPRRMRSLQRPDSLGKHFHRSRRISFFLFSIVPLCCLPPLPPPRACPQASFALGQRQVPGCCAHIIPSGRQEGQPQPAEWLRGCWGRPQLLQRILLCPRCPVAMGRTRLPSCSWLPLVSPKKHVQPLGVMGSDRASSSALILLMVTYLGQ